MIKTSINLQELRNKDIHQGEGWEKLNRENDNLDKEPKKALNGTGGVTNSHTKNRISIEIRKSGIARVKALPYQQVS